jgi:uncharacterized protein
MKVLIISDTHNSLPIDIDGTGCDAVIHAGDIGDDKFFTKLNCREEFFAVAGNTDYISTASLPETLCGKIEGVKFFLVHNLSAPHRIISSNLKELYKCVPDLVVFGHTHTPLIQKKDGIIFLNPGSLGKSGLTGFRSYAIAEISGSSVLSIKIYSAEDGNIIESWTSSGG